VDIGSSYLPSELNAAYLWPQLEDAELINAARLSLWNQYLYELSPLAEAEKLELPVIPRDCAHNAHMFYIKTKDIDERTALVTFLREQEIGSVFHYIPLHSSPAGRRYGHFVGVDAYTTRESERLLRLPMYYGLCAEEVSRVSSRITDFYR
jgi:dTDP-4-amino-4,6-dideoxygalactose transaminase